MSFCGAALLMLSAHWFPSGKEGQLPTTEKKRPRIRRSRGDRLHSVPHPPFGLPPCVSKRRLAALSRCPDADCILPASAIGWNGTKVCNVINRGAGGFLSEHWVRLRNSQA